MSRASGAFALLVALTSCSRNPNAAARLESPQAALASPSSAARDLPRVVAYVHCLCGFGVGSSNGACLDEPDPNVNQVERWEREGVSPITQYVISFLSFDEHSIKTDSGSVWANGGGSTTDFALDEHLLRALRAAQARGKQVWLSLGGESGSEHYLLWWANQGGSTEERVGRMRAELARVAARFESQNGIRVDGFDADIELFGFYAKASDKYAATRDLINAVPEPFRVAFVPQVSNGLCAAPAPGDALPAAAVLGQACERAPGDTDPSWVLAELDRDCRNAHGGPRLEYFGVQYYNVENQQCCGGGTDPAAIAQSTAQHYVNLSNGWPAESDHMTGHRWPAFRGIGADRLVIGKPGCSGCADDGYLDVAAMSGLIASLDGRLTRPMGGILFWELCRMFEGGSCGERECQPSWGGKDIVANLGELRRRMAALRKR